MLMGSISRSERVRLVLDTHSLQAALVAEQLAVQMPFRPVGSAASSSPVLHDGVRRWSADCVDTGTLRD